MAGHSGSLTIIAVTMPLNEGSEPGLSWDAQTPIPGWPIMLFPPMHPLCGFVPPLATAGAARSTIAAPPVTSETDNLFDHVRMLSPYPSRCQYTSHR